MLRAAVALEKNETRLSTKISKYPKVLRAKWFNTALFLVLFRHLDRRIDVNQKPAFLMVNRQKTRRPLRTTEVAVIRSQKFDLCRQLDCHDSELILIGLTH